MKDFSSIQPRQKYKILLLGDDCIDVYQYGTVNRLSPEAPVPVFTYEYEEQRPGMAANVKVNLEALGCDVSYLHGETSVKTRLIERRSKQHVVRIDNDKISNPIRFETAIPKYDAIVISDYNKGTIDYELITDLIKTVTVPIFIDTKKTDLAILNGCYIKINQLEASRATSQPHPSWLITTLGDKGATWNGTTFSAEAAEVADVCGAGDTFLSALAFEFLRTQDIEKSIEFANRAAGISVQHLGCYAPSLEELS